MKPAVICILLTFFCGACGDGRSPVSPTPSTPAAPDPARPAILSCSQVAYRGGTETFMCAIPGQVQQPSAIAKFFPGRSDCLIATCTAGCVSAVRMGTNSGASCQ